MALILLPFLISGYWAYKRFTNHPAHTVPYPFLFKKGIYSHLPAEAPILIIGDSMANRLSSFKERLAQKISINLSKQIKVLSLATEGENIHRTLAKIKALPKTPLILIYLGQMDQAYEYTFHGQYLQKINENFDYLRSDRIHTAILLFPVLSKFIFKPIKYVTLDGHIHKDANKYNDQDFQNRTALHYTLYQESLKELFKIIKKKNALIIPLTTPINLDTPPLKSCYGSLSDKAPKKIKKLLSLLQLEKFKEAYNLGKELTLTNPYNAQINFLYAKVLKKVNRFKEAQQYGELAKIYDCANHSGNPIYNSILRKEAKSAGIEFLDFHQLLVDESQKNFVFLDETYPQDYYLKVVIDALALKIKKRLKL